MSEPIPSATPEPTPAASSERAQECPGDGTGRRFKHAWTWMWTDGPSPTWLDRVRCLTCGGEEERTGRYRE